MLSYAGIRRIDLLGAFAGWGFGGVTANEKLEAAAGFKALRIHP
ncbi:MAG: hypothetical protein AABX01_05565 [Candidatus Micrarchaeota archaeon]